jgi:hypothetical protein
MKEVNIKTKKLKVKWTREMAADLNSFHGLDTNLEEQLASMIRIESRKKTINKIWKYKN